MRFTAFLVTRLNPGTRGIGDIWRDIRGGCLFRGTPTLEIYAPWVCVMPRHERDQSFLVPVPAKKSLRSWSRSLQKQILGEGSTQKYFVYGLGPKKSFWSWSCSEKILVLVLVKKKVWSRSWSR
jgi:hypothetical protein